MARIALTTPLRLTASNLAAARGGFRLFEGLSFALSGGEALAVTGPNGVGKTTLLRLIAGFIAPEEGSLALEGAGPDAALPESLHFLGHRDGLKGALTVRENLGFAMSLGGEAGEPIAAIADRLNLKRLLDLPTSVLSAGQRRRAAFARLLAVQRRIWLLDEPTAALDAASSELVAGLIRDHLAGGGLAIAATHLPLGVRASELAFDAAGGFVLRGSP
jgi:heme exporter protein A